MQHPHPAYQMVQPVQQVQQVRQVQHGPPVQQVHQVQHEQPGQPVQQVQYGQPVQQVQYGQPVQQVQYGQPVQQVQLQYPVQQPLTIVRQPTPQPSSNYFRSSALKQMKVISLMQTSMGIFCVIFGIVTTALTGRKYYDDVYGPESFGYGIWIGLFFAVVGGIGMGAVKFNTSRWIITTMVLNIICTSLWCGLLVGFSAVALGFNSIRNCDYTGYDNDLNNNLNYYYPNSRNIYDCLLSRKHTFDAMESLMLMIGIIQFAITIWCACLCCGAICRCCKGSTGVNMYNNPSGPYYPYQVTQPTAAGQGYAIDSQQVQLGGLVTSPPSYASVAPPMQGSTNPNYTSQSSAIPSQSTAGTETQGFIPQTQSAEPEAIA